MKSIFIHSKTRTTDNVDWAKALQNYLGKLYGSFTDLTKETNTINKLRLDLNTNNDDSNKSFLKDLYYKYYGQLELLDLRLPVNELGVRIKFTWYDAYDENKNYTQHSLAFEKASILFNLGSILSSIASDKFTEGDYKSSYQIFQYSAGVYKFISENFLHAPSQDLDGKTIAFLQFLQLSQAQEVFLLKLISEDPSKYSLIAKISMAVHNYYETTFENYEKLNEFKFGESTKWNNILSFKKNFYYNISLYNYALSIEEKKIGESIAFMTKAQSGFESLKKLENQTGIDFKTYKSQSEDKIKTLTRDNDFIYHDLIPSNDSIDPSTIIKPFDAVKPISLNDHANITEIIGEDIFEKIIPINVHEKLSYYSEEKAKILRNEIDKNETKNIELDSFLEYLNLPNSLENFKNNFKQKLDSNLISWSNEINDSPYGNIEENNQKIKDKKSIVLTTIKDLESKLNQEEQDYNEQKFKLGNSQESSYDSSINLKDELTNAKQSILSATKLDQDLNKSIESEISKINQLKSTQILESIFFHNDDSLNLLDIDDSQNDKNLEKINKIESNLNYLHNAKQERFKIIDDLKQQIHNDDISKLLVLNNKKLNENDEKLLFEQELLKFEPYIDRLDSIIFKQSKIIKEIKILYDDLLSSNDQLSKNSEKLKKFKEVYKIFKEYELNFPKSLKFYDNLIEFINDVEKNVLKFINDRYSQRDRLLNNNSQQQQQPDLLRDRFNKLNINQSSSPQPLYKQQSYTGSISSNQSYEQPIAPSLNHQRNSPQLPPKPIPQSYQSYQPLTPSQNPSNFGLQQPPLPPKQPSQQQFNYPSVSTPPPPPPSQQQQSSNNGFYGTPSVYDPSLYKTFGQSQQQQQQQPLQPRYSYPYDPNKPYQ
ncbi:Vacuolar protein-sorting protein bro1 [Wickerhamomyces ciferrii]|uniref:BRO domain-containing protein 1 n=1 Tax=Wickerhamomyces ciferrii (strain ATCC 14091 / BCRC 22168 / CBS 111 / JCM 3599 / NBRC 0793 / NRRL Y-1031 F-60-10) TaxID=1206466 RepID=K0KQ33_WICCF|nr:Vacuolar protein-sorting protein bro1 [Wickerhamomyces ciferrii]CCH43288.1 Vacuolar protein-sorting protein bro1 [Wickerhamomyces ciferrii]